MSKLNEMRMYTWQSQGLNYVDANIGLKEKQDYNKPGSSNKRIR